MVAQTRRSSFRSRLEAALVGAVDDLRDRVGSENVYAFVLYTSGMDGFAYVLASANTEEGLSRIAERYAGKDPAYAGEAGRNALRWSACDWELHDFSPAVCGLELPDGESKARDRRVYADFAAALKALDDRRAFGEGSKRPTLAIMCGDMTDEAFERSLKLLNPPAVLAAYRSKYTPEPYLDELARLPPGARLEAHLGLYRELSLDLSTARATDAKRRNVTRSALEPAIRKLGAAASSRLLDFIEEHGFGPTFNETGSEAWKKSGAFTVESNLATSAIFLAGDAGLAETEVRRVQGMIGRRVEIDRVTQGVTSPLAACMARVLHAVSPKRFPEARQSPVDNRLENPEAFVGPT